MHDAVDRAVRVIADRVGALLGLHDKLGRIGHELSGDRIGGIGAVDQFAHRRSDGDGVLRRDFFQRGALVACDEPGFAEFGEVTQGFRRGVHQFENPMALTILPQLSTSLL